MSYNILVIEDNPADAALIRIHLGESSLSHKLFHTESLREGLQIIKDQNIDLVLLDLSLNDSIGFSTLKHFMEEDPDTPVIVMTGMNSEIVGIQSVRAGAQDFLVKGDFDQRSLMKSIRYSMQRFQTQSKLRKAAKELTIKEERNREFQKIAKIGHWEMDIVTSAMKWNAEMYKIFGFQSVSISPTLSDYLHFVSPDDRERMENFFREASVRDGEVHEIRHRILVNNTSRLLSVQAKAKFDEFSDNILLIGNVQDITGRRREEEERPETEAPPAEVPTGITGIGYRLQLPLFEAIHYLEQLSESKVPAPGALNSLRKNIRELFSATNDLLNTALLNPSEVLPQMEDEISLTDYFAHLQRLAALPDQAGRSSFRLAMGNDLPDILRTEKYLFTQLFNSLGHFLLQTFPGNTQGYLHFDCIRDPEESYLKIHCRHAGPPLLKERLEQLNQAEKKERELAWNQAETHPYALLDSIDRLTKQFNGRAAWPSDKNGLVSEFTLEIPVFIATPTTSALPSASDGPHHHIRVLLVDDHSMSRLAIRRALTSRSDRIEVEEAENGQEGLNRLQEKNYDLVLMDLQMPVLDGLKAAIRIRTMSKVPIFALTSQPSEEEKASCLAAGMNEYLSKRSETEKLLTKILEYTS